jgi:voltage-gated potassium channel
VLRAEVRSILALVFVLFLTVTISGSLMYMLEGEVQPTVFTSIPVAMWWAVETLTTVGYGDYVPITVTGRFLGGGVATIGIGTLALFSGLITTGFIEQLKIYREQQGRLHVAVSDGISVIEVDYQTGRGGDGAASADEAAVTVAAHASRSAFCPHCGGLLPAPSAGADGREQSLGVVKR